MRGQSAFPHGFGFDPGFGSPVALCRVPATDRNDPTLRGVAEPIIVASRPVVTTRRLPSRRCGSLETEQFVDSRPSMIMISCVIGATLAASTYFLGYL